jgi:hypothetical protein
MKQTEPCSQQEAVDHQIERSLRGDPCRAAVNFVDVRLRGERRFQRCSPHWRMPPPTSAAVSRRSGDKLGELRKIAGSSITSFRAQFRR